MHPDKAQHTIHRLEAFSDIVIGFCLAELGLSLVLPKGASDVFSVWESTTVFISAFIFVAVLWWLHHRTFSAFFILNPSMIVMNFGVLGGLILTLYFLESIVRVAELGQNPSLFFALFVFAFALVYTLVGLMLLTGLVGRRAELPAEDVRWAIGQLTSIAMAVLFGLAAGTYAVRSESLGAIVVVAVALAAAIVVVRRRFVPRWIERSAPNRG